MALRGDPGRERTRARGGAELRRTARARPVTRAWSSWRTYERRPAEERFSDNVAKLFRSVTVSVYAAGGQTVQRPSPNTLVISSKRTGVLVVAVCILLFPLGLLALLARRTERLTITVDERADGFEVSALGQGDPAIIAALETFLAEMVSPDGRLEAKTSPVSSPARGDRRELRPWNSLGRAARGE